MGKGRKPCCDKAGVKKGPWSQAEDFKLISFIQKHGHSNWRALPKLSGLARCGKSCRLRWVNYLRPDLKRGNFTPQEEEAITKLHRELGNKWSLIASKFPGRTDNEIKNVWNTHLKKRIKAKESSKNSQDSCDSLPTSISVDDDLDENSKDCSEQIGVTQQTSIDIVEHSSSSSSSYSSQPPCLDHQMEELNPQSDHLDNPSSKIVEENIYHKDETSVTSDKCNEHRLDELIEIPFEPNLDLWDLLDIESNSADYNEVNVNEVDNTATVFTTTENTKSSYNSNIDNTGESWWWLVYLENELGLVDQDYVSSSPQSITGSNHELTLKADECNFQF